LCTLHSDDFNALVPKEFRQAVILKWDVDLMFVPLHARHFADFVRTGKNEREFISFENYISEEWHPLSITQLRFFTIKYIMCKLK